MEQFYTSGRADLKGGLKLAIDVPEGWNKFAYVEVTVSSPDGEEGKLDGFLKRNERGGLELIIETWEKKTGDLELEPAVAEAVNCLSELEGEVMSDLGNVMFYLLLQYLGHRYPEEIAVFRKEVREVSRVWFDMDEVARLTAGVLGF